MTLLSIFLHNYTSLGKGLKLFYCNLPNNQTNLFYFSSMILNYIYGGEALGSVEFTPSLPLLPGLLWSKVEAPVRVPSMGQIHLFKNYKYQIKFLELYNHKNNYYYSPCEIFTSVLVGVFFIGVWMIASPLKSSERFWVFWPILTML